MNAIELQEQLRQRRMTRMMFVEKLQSTDKEFGEIRGKFTRGKYDTYFDLIPGL